MSGLQTFPGKKKYNYFFYPKKGKKKYNILEKRESEWHANFSGKKKYDTFAVTVFQKWPLTLPSLLSYPSSFIPYAFPIETYIKYSRPEIWLKQEH